MTGSVEINNTSPKLSIITVNLNNKDGLIDTAESIINQTWTDFEWIIIDGGSNDGSVEIIKEYAEKTDKLVYWCSEPDGGIYQGMNKGIDKANGEYCWFLNSGDYAYRNTTLEEVFFYKFNEDIVYGDLVLKYNKNIFKYEFIVWSPVMVNTKSSFYWAANHNSLPHSGGTFFSRDILKKVNGYDIKYKTAADKFLYMVSIFKYDATVRYLPIIMAFFIVDGISGKKEVINIVKRDNLDFSKKLFPNTYIFIIIIAFIKYRIIKIIPFFYFKIINIINKYICYITGRKYLIINRSNKKIL